MIAEATGEGERRPGEHEQSQHGGDLRGIPPPGVRKLRPRRIPARNARTAPPRMIVNPAGTVLSVITRAVTARAANGSIAARPKTIQALGCAAILRRENNVLGWVGMHPAVILS